MADHLSEDQRFDAALKLLELDPPNRDHQQFSSVKESIWVRRVKVLAKCGMNALNAKDWRSFIKVYKLAGVYQGIFNEPIERRIIEHLVTSGLGMMLVAAHDPYYLKLLLKLDQLSFKLIDVELVEITDDRLLHNLYIEIHPEFKSRLMDLILA
jgi:hypothetical protein